MENEELLPPDEEPPISSAGLAEQEDKKHRANTEEEKNVSEKLEEPIVQDLSNTTPIQNSPSPEQSGRAEAVRQRTRRQSLRQLDEVLPEAASSPVGTPRRTPATRSMPISARPGPDTSRDRLIILIIILIVVILLRRLFMYLV